MKNVIFALDAVDSKDVKKYCRQLVRRKEITDDIFAIKIGTVNIIDQGLSIIATVQRRTGLPVICDLKLAEIPTISLDIARKVAKAGAQGIVVQGFVGKDVVKAIREDLPDLDVYLVSEMTHNDGGFTQQHMKGIADIAKQHRLAGIIGPGNRIDRLKELISLMAGEVKVVAAGVSIRQGGTEAEAIRAGADLIIKGSDLRNDLRKVIRSDKSLRFLLMHIVLIAGAGFVLAFALMQLLGTQWHFLAEQPILSVVVASIFAMLAGVSAYIREK
jgi:orotidine-5'-phosphate decarboxylase